MPPKGKRPSLHSLFIVFIGPVGVGKSTVITGLSYVFNSLGIKVYKGFLKAFHGAAYVLWWFITTLLYNIRGHIAPWYVVGKLNRKIAEVLTLISLYIDAFINIPLKILLMLTLKSLGYIVLCEEYTYSTLFDYLYSFTRRSAELRFYVLFPLKVIHVFGVTYKPDFIVFLDANINVLLRRWNKRGYGDPQLIYVIAQRKFLKFLNTILYGKVMYIDTSTMRVGETIRIILYRVIC